MKRSLLLLCLAAVATLCSAQQNVPPPGFKALFNGKDLSGWYGWGTRDPVELWNMSPQEQADYKKKSIEGGLPIGKAGPEHVNAHWSVQNGELVNDGKGLYLTSNKDYGDFDLIVEYKALPDGDSGIYLRGIPQVQIWDTTKGDPRNLGQDKGSGGLWNNSKDAPGKDPSKKMDKPFGEWNRFEIRMIGERVTVVFNGEKVVDNAVLENFFANRKAGYLAYAKPDPKAKEPVKKPAGFMRDPAYVKGPIQLQTHGSEIRWRNVFIREIPPEEANRILAAQAGSGFLEQINGKDLSNWQGSVDSYEIKNGAIVCKPGKGGDLLTKEEFENGIIRTEFRLPVAGNNGIAIRTPATGKSADEGLEIQVLDSDGYNAKQAAAGKPGLLPFQYHGSVYYCVPAKHGFLRPTGEWNYQEIEVRGQNIKVTLNGTKILDVNLDEIDRSELKKVPKGLDKTKGFVGLAGHNDPVEFRSFQIKRF